MTIASITFKINNYDILNVLVESELKDEKLKQVINKLNEKIAN